MSGVHHVNMEMPGNELKKLKRKFCSLQICIRMEIFSKQTQRLPGLWLYVVRNASEAEMDAQRELENLLVSCVYVSLGRLSYRNPFNMIISVFDSCLIIPKPLA